MGDSRERQVACENEIPKGQELSCNKLTAGIGGEKGKKRGAGLKKMKLSLYSCIPSTSPALHNHWLLLVCLFTYNILGEAQIFKSPTVGK